MSSELENSGIRVAVGDCSVTERRRWRPPYQTGKTVHVHAKTLQTQGGRTHGAGCARPWICTTDFIHKWIHPINKDRGVHCAFKWVKFEQILSGKFI